MITDLIKKIYKEHIKKTIVPELLLKRKICRLGKGVVVENPFQYGAIPGNIIIGDNTTILSNARLNSFANSNSSDGKIIIGSGCYICYRFSCLAVANVKIGNNVLIASDVLIAAQNHGIDPECDIEYMNQQLSGEDVTIGDGCWIGEKVCVLSGVTIGKKSVIGAGSVVTKDIPEYCIAVGNPAKVIKRYNFSVHLWEAVE